VSRRWACVEAVAGANADVRVVECAGVSAIVEGKTALIAARLVVRVVEATSSALAGAEAEVAAAVELRRSSCAGVCRIISGAGMKLARICGSWREYAALSARLPVTPDASRDECFPLCLLLIAPSLSRPLSHTLHTADARGEAGEAGQAS
jgi:hypothetical protein